MHKYLITYTLLLLLFAVSCEGQVKKEPEIVKGYSGFFIKKDLTADIYAYSTEPILDKKCQQLSKDTAIIYAVILDTLPKSNSKIVNMGSSLVIISTNDFYQNSTITDQSMILRKVNRSTGVEEAKQTLMDDVGFSIVSIHVHNEFIYLLYYREINAKDRDLFLAKLDSGLNMSWDVELGKRFGNTDDMDVISVDANDNVYLFTCHQGQPILELFNSKGELLKKREYDFGHRLYPKSFVLNDKNEIFAIGTGYVKEDNNNYTISSVVFKIDSGFLLTRKKYIKSISPGLESDINELTADSPGGIIKYKKEDQYLIWIHSSNKHGNKGSYYFNTLLLIDSDFNVKKTINLKDYSHGPGPNLIITDDNIFLSTNDRNLSVVLNELSKDFELLNNYCIQGLNDHQTMEYISGQLVLNGGMNKPWVIKINPDKL